MEHVDILILGAGISGITAARFLNSPCLVIERKEVPGGLSSQYQSGPYWFDYGGHYFHFKNSPAIQDSFTSITPFRMYRRRSRIFMLNRFIPFPLQDHIDFLPQSFRNPILNEIAGDPGRRATRMDLHLKLRFGPTLYGLFFQPFMTKYYGQELSSLSVGLEQGSIPLPDKSKLQPGDNKKTGDPRGYNPVFFYPQKGLRHFWDKYCLPVNAQLRLGEEVTSVNLESHRLETQTRTYQFRKLISSLPLPQFLAMARGLPDTTEHRKLLRHTSTRVVNVVLAARRRRFHWVYLPEKATPFYRFGYYPDRNHCSAYLEQSLSPSATLDPDAIRTSIESALGYVGAIADPTEIRHISIRDIPISYILHDPNWLNTVPPLLALLRKNNVYSIGRYGAWTYSSMAADALMARNTAMEINHPST